MKKTHTMAMPHGLYWEQHGLFWEQRGGDLARPQQMAAPDPRRVAFKANLDRFVAEFGAQCGTRYAADGLTIDQARARHAEFVAAVRRCGEIWAEENHRAELTKRLSPAIGTGAAAFAARLKLPT